MVTIRNLNIWQQQMSRHGDTPEATQKGKDTGAFLEEKKTLNQNIGKIKHLKIPFPEAKVQHLTLKTASTVL